MAPRKKKKEEVSVEQATSTAHIELMEDPSGVATQATVQKTYNPKQFDPNQIVTVRNGFQGRLVYKSRRTGERFVWDKFGEEQDMEISELRTARNSNKKFFEENWFLFDDPEVVEYLNVGRYYKFALDLEDFDTVFDMPVEEMRATINRLSNGQKKSLVYLAKQRISNGEIDSIKQITMLENELGVELIER